jgi:hypothetical protein
MPQPLYYICIYMYFCQFFFSFIYLFFKGKKKLKRPKNSPRLHAAIDVLRSAGGWRCAGRLRLRWRPVSLAEARHHFRVSLCTIFDFTRHRPCHWLRTKVPALGIEVYIIFKWLWKFPCGFLVIFVLLNSTQNSLHLCSSNVIADTVHFCFSTFERKKKKKKPWSFWANVGSVCSYMDFRNSFFCFLFNVFSLLRKCGMMNSFLSDILFLGHPYTHQSSNT